MAGAGEGAAPAPAPTRGGSAPCGRGGGEGLITFVHAGSRPHAPHARNTPYASCRAPSDGNPARCVACWKHHARSHTQAQGPSACIAMWWYRCSGTTQRGVSAHTRRQATGSRRPPPLPAPPRRPEACGHDPRAPQPGSLAGCHSQLLARPVWLQGTQRTRPLPLHPAHGASGGAPSRQPPVLPRPPQAEHGRWPEPKHVKHLRGFCARACAYGRRGTWFRGLPMRVCVSICLRACVRA